MFVAIFGKLNVYLFCTYLDAKYILTKKFLISRNKLYDESSVQNHKDLGGFSSNAERNT